MSEWEIAYGTPDQPESWEGDNLLDLDQWAKDYERQELADLAEYNFCEQYERHGL